MIILLIILLVAAVFFLVVLLNIALWNLFAGIVTFMLPVPFWVMCGILVVSMILIVFYGYILSLLED
jgi:hypothetical protein